MKGDLLNLGRISNNLIKLLWGKIGNMAAAIFWDRNLKLQNLF